MSLFKKLTNAGLEQTEDRLGGGGVVETDLYTGKIKMAYAGKSDGGAQFISLEFEHTGGKRYRETIYITNKQGENWFLNKQDSSKKVPLPGFVIIDDLCLCTTEKPLSDQDTEEKMVNIYDYELKKEVPKKVPVLVELLDQTVSLAIVKSIEDKTKKEGNEYVPTGETREVNTIDKVFHTESKLTMVEVRNEIDTSAFWDAWVDKNKGKTRDKTGKGAKTASSGAPGKGASGAPTAAASDAPKKSLFGSKK